MVKARQSAIHLRFAVVINTRYSSEIDLIQQWILKAPVLQVEVVTTVLQAN